MSLLIGRIGKVLTPELRARLRPPVDFGNVRSPGDVPGPPPQRAPGARAFPGGL